MGLEYEFFTQIEVKDIPDCRAPDVSTKGSVIENNYSTSQMFVYITNVGTRLTQMSTICRIII